YCTEPSRRADRQGWADSSDPAKRAIGNQWRDLVGRELPWVAVCSRNLVFAKDDSEQASIFSDAALVEHKLRQLLPRDIADLPLRVDIARTIFRPHTAGPAARQNL